MTNPFIKRNTSFRMPSNLKNFIEKRKAMVNAPAKGTEASKINYDESEYIEFKKQLEKILIERQKKEKLNSEIIKDEEVKDEVKIEELNISNEKKEIEEPESILGKNENVIIYDDASFQKIKEDSISEPEPTKAKKAKKSKKTEVTTEEVKDTTLEA